jgi:hypothetical protein
MKMICHVNTEVTELGFPSYKNGMSRKLAENPPGISESSNIIIRQIRWIR